MFVSVCLSVSAYVCLPLPMYGCITICLYVSDCRYLSLLVSVCMPLSADVCLPLSTYTVNRFIHPSRFSKLLCIQPPHPPPSPTLQSSLSDPASFCSHPPEATRHGAAYAHCVQSCIHCVCMLSGGAKAVMRDMRVRGPPAPATKCKQLRFFSLLKNQFLGSLFAGCPLLRLFVYVHVCNQKR